MYLKVFETQKELNQYLLNQNTNAAYQRAIAIQREAEQEMTAVNAIIGVPGYILPPQSVKCAYCGTPRTDKTHNCRNCAGLEVA